LAGPLLIGGVAVPAGEMRRIELDVARLPTHTMLRLPVTVLHGRREGARLWLSATLHGDELNGMEIIRRVLARISPASLRGAVLAVPIVNVFGFVTQSRYLPDRRDLNRSFPGSRTGSLAAQLAHLVMEEIVGHATHGIDLHTAAPPRVNLPQVRGNLDDPETERCARAFRAPVMLHSKPPAGSLRAAAARRGMPVLLYEAGEPLRFNPRAIETGVDGVLRVMAQLGMIDRARAPRGVRSVRAARSKWIRAPQSGVLNLDVTLGGRVVAGRALGAISDPLGESAVKVVAPFSGIVIGQTNNPLVHRGDAVVHLAEPRR